MKIYYLFYDDPELIEDMVAFQEYRYGKTCLNDFYGCFGFGVKIFCG